MREADLELHFVGLHSMASANRLLRNGDVQYIRKTKGGGLEGESKMLEMLVGGLYCRLHELIPASGEGMFGRNSTSGR